MNQKPKDASELQSMIQKYSQELLKANQRKTLLDSEYPVVNPKSYTPQPVAEYVRIPENPMYSEPTPLPIETATTPIVQTEAPVIQTQAAPIAVAPQKIIPAKEVVSVSVPTLTDFDNDNESTMIAPSHLRPRPNFLNDTVLTKGSILSESFFHAATPTISDEYLSDEACALSPSQLRPHSCLFPSGVTVSQENTPTESTQPVNIAAHTDEYLRDDDNIPSSQSSMPVSSSIKETLSNFEPDAETFSSEPIIEKLTPPATGIALLQVHVTTARRTLPIRNARVVITRYEGEKIILHKVSKTSFTGSTPPLPLPAFLADPSSNADSTAQTNYTIEVSEPGYYKARLIHVPLHGGVAAVKTIDLVPLPNGGDSNEEIVIDESMPQSKETIAST